MAYPYVNPYLQNGFYTPYIAPQTPQVVQPAVNPPVAQNAPTVANSALVWVQGETGAKSYMVAPNTTVLLMDSESQKFYLKSADASGMPLPLRVFEYTETTQNGSESMKATEVDKYITRDEFERRMAEIASKPIKKKSEVIADE